MPLDMTFSLERILAQLRSERELLDQAIGNLEGLTTNGRRRRGRPPGRLSMPASIHVKAMGAHQSLIDPGEIN